MNTSNSHIISVYKSRQNILDILQERGYDITQYNNFTFNEIGIMVETDQLDLLIEHSSKKKVYIKYYINKILKQQNIYEIVEDLHHLENILSKTDDLIIIIKDEPNDTLIQTVKDIWMNDGIYISLLNIKRLQFNILKHKLVPKHTVLSSVEKENVKKQYNILSDDDIPDISYFSPVSLVLGVRPGDLIKIERNSRTSITSNFYRICKI